VIVAENKYDLYVEAAASVTPSTPSESGGSRFHRSPSEEALLQRKRQQIVAMMQRFPFVRQSIKCSAKDFLRVDDVFLKAQQAVLYPFTPLYDLQKGRMSLQLERALIRMFRIYDMDQDGLLSDAEMERFQRQVVYLDYELVTWKKIVSRHNDPPLPSPVLSPDGKFTVTGFLVIFDVCINQNRLEKVWEALRVFGYDDELQLVLDDGDKSHSVEKNFGKDNNMSRRMAKSSSWKLSGSERRFLASLFQQFATASKPEEGNEGRDTTQHLAAQDMTRLFAIVDPPLPPWSAQRAPTLLQNAWAQPKQYFSSSSKGNSSPASSSLSDEQTHHQNPPSSPTDAHNPLSSSGVSILSASDSLPSVGSVAAATTASTSLSQKPMDLMEWMGHWHLLAATAPRVTKQELFRLGYMDHHHRLQRSRKSGQGPTGSLPYRSQEIRVLVVGNSQKTKVLHSICCADPSAGGLGSPTSSVCSSLASTIKISGRVGISSPEISQTHLKLKRNRSKHRKSTPTQSRAEEVVTHFVFIDVPESSVPDVFVESSTRDAYDMVALVFDVTDVSTLEYCQTLERKFLRDDMPRVFMAANLDKLGENDPAKASVIRAATQHCTAAELEGQPLLFSLSALTGESLEGSESNAREAFLDILARSYLRREPGIVGLQSSPYEAQKRRRDQLVKGIGLGFLVVIGVGICSLALFKSWFFTSSAPTPTSTRKK